MLLKKYEVQIIASFLLAVLLTPGCWMTSHDSDFSLPVLDPKPPAFGPYVLELNGSDGTLMYYGARHSMDPDDPQMEDIEHHWDDFKPTTAFLEGGIWPLDESRSAAIRNSGEQGLVRFLADRDGARIRSIDPTPQSQARHLLRRFPPDQIKVYFVLLHTMVMCRSGKQPPSLRYVELILNDFNRIPAFSCSPCNPEEFQRFIAHTFDEMKDWRSISDLYFYQPAKGRFLVRMHQCLSEFRDRHMLKVLSKAVKNGERIFAVVGHSHVAVQEPVLRTMLQ